MKYLLVLLVVVGVLAWMLRRPKGSARPRGRQPRSTTDIVACAHCGVHVPATDALGDGRLRYCCEAHRLAGPRSDNAP